MLLCNLECSCLASLALAYLVVHDVWVKGSCVSPGCRLVARTKIKYTLGHILVFIFNSFTNARALFSFLYLRPHPAFAPCGLRVRGKSVESRTRTVSSHATLAGESRWLHSARVYSWHKKVKQFSIAVIIFCQYFCKIFFNHCKVSDRIFSSAIDLVS